jgi:hypothetical protein
MDVSRRAAAWMAGTSPAMTARAAQSTELDKETSK